MSVDIVIFHPKLRFIVQDLPNQEAIFDARVPSVLWFRISFQAHDFFAPQPVKDADVYLLSSVLHDWSDELAAKILRQLLPTMKPNSRILLFEGVMGAFGDVSNMQMRFTKNADLTMPALLNGKERTRDNWTMLVKRVDERLMMKNVVRPAVGGPKWLIEVGFRDS